MKQSTTSPRSRKATKPKKPYAAFPLSPHASGKWQKKILGKIHYFGNWARRINGKLERVEGDGWKEALELYKSQAEDLHAGREPRAVDGDGLTLLELCNKFLQSKERKVAARELGLRMFNEYRDIKNLLVEKFGGSKLVDSLTPGDFESLREDMASRWGPARLSNSITSIKSFFKYGTDNLLIEKAIRYGTEFKKPSKAVMRKHKATRPKKTLEAEDIRKLIDAAEQPLRSMILLALNAGFGNNDCATLPISAVNLKTGWVEYPRPKTGIDRRCPLWPETAAAIEEAIALRPNPVNDEDKELLFINRRGTPFIRFVEKAQTDLIGEQFCLLIKKLGLHQNGIGFYVLRHVFRTEADAARDPVAIDLIMGHTDPSMGANYRERIDDSRLKAVTDHVRAWLWPERVAGGTGGVS